MLIYKKPKRKRLSSDHSALWTVVYWTAAFAFFMWLVWAVWGGSKGQLGNKVASGLFVAFGQASKLLPVFILYWLARSIRHKTLAVITLLAGSALILCGLCAEISLLKKVFSKEALAGGWVGDNLYEFFHRLSGNGGAFFFSLVALFTGIHVLFAIPWLATMQKVKDILKNDFDAWLAARSELEAKIRTAKNENLQDNAPRRVVAEDEEDERSPAKPPPKIMRSAGGAPLPVAEMIKLPPEINKEPRGEEKEEKIFVLPPLSLLNSREADKVIGPSDGEIASATKRLEDTLDSFDIAASVTGVAPGPVVTRYEIKPEPGVKISSIVSISNDIALAMKARGIRVEAPIPGKDAIGFEIPNERPVTVTLREILADKSFADSKYKTTIALGRSAEGLPSTAVIEKMPHLLIAGATNSGKSICVHSIIVSLLYRAKPDEIKLLLIDPKRVELTLYEGIPHLYDPKTTCEDASVIKNANDAVKSLQALVKVMEKRMHLFEFAKVKNIEAYNKQAERNGEKKLFYIVAIIDELADLMLQTRAAIEDSVQRLTQMGRALGIHLILCTQRPSTNVITGVIKANLPSRIALQVTSKVDSRVVLDSNGAETLLGKGDMLYLGISDAKPRRIQGAYISEEEITKAADFLREQGGPDYPVQIVMEQERQIADAGLGMTREELKQALNLIKKHKCVSHDLLKANFGGSARATNMIVNLKTEGFISKPEGKNKWQIDYGLIDRRLEELLAPQAAQEGETSYETVYK